MGNTSSQPEDLYPQIKRELEELLSDYDQWSRPEVCDRLAVVYKDRLMEYESDSLQRVALVIGIQPELDDREGKEGVCLRMVDHFRRRIQMVQRLHDSLVTGMNRINQVSKGRVCQGVDRYVDVATQCDELKGVWLESEPYQQALKKFKEEATDVQKWEGWLDRLEEETERHYRHILKLIKRLKSWTGVMPESDLQQLEQLVEDVCGVAAERTDALYLVLINRME